MFPDGMNLPHPPFAKMSGMTWGSVDRDACMALGLITGDESPSDISAEFAADIRADADANSLADLVAVRDALQAASRRLREAGGDSEAFARAKINTSVSQASQQGVGPELRELTVLAERILADGEMSTEEFLELASWVQSHPGTEDWPVSVVVEMVKDILADGIATSAEQSRLEIRLREIFLRKRR
jgi:hypothetical protein